MTGEETHIPMIPNEHTASENTGIDGSTKLRSRLFSVLTADNLSKRIRLKPHQVRTRKPAGDVLQYGKYYYTLGIKMLT